MVVMSEDKWQEFTPEQRKLFIIVEANIFCATNIALLREGATPSFLVQKRCAYIADLIEPVNKECGELCLLASKADKPSEFIKYCKKSAELWNRMVRKEREDENRRAGIV